MFTGLIQTIGKISVLKSHEKGTEFFVECNLSPFELGESIAVHGACLTVTSMRESGFGCYASLETLQKTKLGSLNSGERVHLERALRVGDPIGGHFVSGHVDGVAKVKSRHQVEESLRMIFEVPIHLSTQLASKGSITVDGVSLTINQVHENTFSVMLIPHTLGETLLGSIEVGGQVNIETDILAKYVESFLGSSSKKSSSSLDKESLVKAGFIKA